MSTPEDARVPSEAESYWRTDDRFTPAHCDLLERVFNCYPEFEQSLTPAEHARLAGIVKVLSDKEHAVGQFGSAELCFWYPLCLPRHITRAMMHGKEKVPPLRYRLALDEGRTRRFLEQVLAFNEAFNSAAVTAPGKKASNGDGQKAWMKPGPPPNDWPKTSLLGQIEQFAEWMGTTPKTLRSPKNNGVTHLILRHVGCDPETKWPAPFEIYFPTPEKFSSINAARRVAADKYIEERKQQELAAQSERERAPRRPQSSKSDRKGTKSDRKGKGAKGRGKA